MNREIKFRGKRVDNNEWVYGSLYQERHPYKNKIIQTMIVEYRPDLRLVSGASDNNHWWRDVIPESVGQFTGLFDKNGKEIYEDDIVQRGIIGFYRGKFVGVYYGFGGLYEEWEDDLYQKHGIEVIGNVFDNPELLE